MLTSIAAQHALALAKVPKDSGARRHITAATRTIEMAGRLTHHLLDCAGRGKRVAEAVELNRHLHEFKELIRSLLPAGVCCHLESDCDPLSASPRIGGDWEPIVGILM